MGGLLTAAVVGCGWYLYHQVNTNLISSAPSDIKIEAPTEAESRAAENSYARLKAAIANNTETTISFTGPELNALLLSDTDLKFLRNRGRIAIANSVMSVDMSAPLDALPWPGMKGRWFNGTVRFTFAYADGRFRVDLESAKAGEHEFPGALLSTFNSSFNDSLNEAFQQEIDKNRRETEFWKHIKSMSLQGDKLIVTTKPE